MQEDYKRLQWIHSVCSALAIKENAAKTAWCTGADSALGLLMQNSYSSLMGRMNVSPWVLTAGSRKQPIKRTLTDGDKQRTFVNLSRSRHLQYSNRLNKDRVRLIFRWVERWFNGRHKQVQVDKWFNRGRFCWDMENDTLASSLQVKSQKNKKNKKSYTTKRDLRIDCWELSDAHHIPNVAPEGTWVYSGHAVFGRAC